MGNTSLAAVALFFGVAMPSLLATSHAYAETYFCSPETKQIGSYLPDDSNEEVTISVRWPDSTPFWFDDQNGDVITYRDGGEIGALEVNALKVPLPTSMFGDGSRESLVSLMVRAELCQKVAMGVLP